MNNGTWQIKTFDELTTQELQKIYYLRTEVFVVEQKCPYQEVDNLDLVAKHLWYENETGEILAYLRIIPAGAQFDAIAIGRVLVKQTARGAGLARQLFQHGLDQVSCHTVQIEAQYYLREFYKSFGFVEISEQFLEDGIPHVAMVRKVHD
ncbi:MAG: GNAT family N-acetyltransferase [Streptococcaceae bacterium]|nr:GNAT family N-acetyltransferase [Streptococcaceae bacterium]